MEGQHDGLCKQIRTSRSPPARVEQAAYARTSRLLTTRPQGVYIHDSRVAKANASLALARTCALGRPWNALHRSLFVDTDLDESVLPAGYVAWSAADPRVVPNVTTMAEYHNRGPGWNATARAAGAVGVVLSAAQYELYSSVEKVFQYPGEGRFGNVGWIDRDVEGEVSGYVNQGQPLNL